MRRRPRRARGRRAPAGQGSGGGWRQARRAIMPEDRRTARRRRLQCRGVETEASARSDLLDRVRQRRWYHTLELGDGVVTDGWFDLRPYVHHYGLPERLEGLRALEVGTWDGFWAFELERRGAEVVALDLDDERDLDWPPRRRPTTFPDAPRGSGFALARELYDSSVERVNCSIYHALPEDLGQFDLVFCGSVLIHLRDQLLALERMAGLTKPGGMLISAEEYDRLASLVPFPVSRYRADRDK